MYTTELIPGRIVFTHSYGIITIEDIRQMSVEGRKLIEVWEQKEAGNPLLHTIIDNTHVEKMDYGINDLKELIFGELIDKSSPNVAWSIQVTPSKIGRFFASVASQFTNIRNRQFDTLEAALAFLAENDDTLPSYDEMLEAYHKLRMTERTLATD